MGRIILPIGPIFKFNNNRVSDHNRSPLDISPSKIENKKRMANGTLRRFIVAEKRKFKVSWENLPKNDAQTADGYWAASSICNFYEATPGDFTITLTYGDNSTENVLVMFDDFNYKINKRSAYTDFYDIDLSLDEI